MTDFTTWDRATLEKLAGELTDEVRRLRAANRTLADGANSQVALHEGRRWAQMIDPCECDCRACNELRPLIAESRSPEARP